MNRKYIVLLLFVMGFGSVAKACDICGCGVGSYYLGILPEYNKRFIGLRYQYKTLTTPRALRRTKSFDGRRDLSKYGTLGRMEHWNEI